MSNEPKKAVSRTNPSEAEAGRGAPGDQAGVQMAQTPAVNPPEEEIPTATDTEQSVEQLKAVDKQEEDTDMTTTDGYVVDESGRLDNYPVEPKPYTEE
jgi:hypothetical protein